MAQKDPISDALLNLYEVHAGRRQAELDLERARTKEAFAGRTAVPGVMAQLAERREKEQKRRESIAKQGAAQEAQGPSPQAMLPQSVEVSGRTGGRDGGGALGEVVKAFVPGGPQPAASGGAAGPPGSFPQRAGAVFGAGASTNQPAPGGVAGPVLGGSGQSAPPASGADPNALIPQKVQLTPGERWATGLRSLLTKDVGAGFEAATGKRTVGYTTLDEQAKQLSPGLSVLIARSHSTSPELATAAEQELDQRRSQIESQLGPDLAATAFRQADDLWLIQDEELRIKREDPLEQTKRRKAELEFGIEEEVAQHGLDSLSPGRRAVFERGRRSTTIGATTIVNQMQKSTRGALEKQLDENRDVMSRIDAFDDAFFAPGYELMGMADKKILQGQDLLGVLGEDGRKRLTRYSEQTTAMAGLNLTVLHPLLGAQMSTGEMSLAGEYIITMGKGGTAAKTAAGHLREMTGLAMFRMETVLESGSMADPRYSMSQGNTKNAARIAIMQYQEKLEKMGVSEAQSIDQTRMDFRNRYGLDVDRLLGIETKQ